MMTPATAKLLKEMRSLPVGVYAPHVFRAEGIDAQPNAPHGIRRARSEEHTSELQSR